MIRRILPVGALSVALALTLAGCTPPADEPTAWQGTVQTVASQASTGDYASALATLDSLEAEVVARRDSGQLDAAEAEAILSRIATVRADLSAMTSTPAPAQTSEPTQTSEPEQTSEPVQTTETVPEEQPSAPTAPVTDEGDEPAAPGDQTDTGPDKSGPGGKNDDKGTDKGNDKGPGKKDE